MGFPDETCRLVSSTHLEESGNFADSMERALFPVHLFRRPGSTKLALRVSRPIPQAFNACNIARSRTSSRPTMLIAMDKLHTAEVSILHIP